jgi:glycerol-3-phosphate acyltransferase PlsY
MYSTKYVSLASIICVFLIPFMCAIPWLLDLYLTNWYLAPNKFDINWIFAILSGVMAILVIYRHKKNIIALYHKKERKI